jgi:6-phosphogluconolactonase
VAETCGAVPGARPPLVVDARPFERAGELLAEAIAAVLQERDRARLAISGGSALDAAVVARARSKDGWARVVLTWVDERCVPVSDAASNRGEAARRGLLDSAASAGEVAGPAYVLPLYEDGEAPAEAVARVRRGWETDLAGGLDVVLLGLGADGHVASLFPAHPAASETGWVAHVADSPKPPANRITLTRVALATARRGVLVAAGDEKRDAVRRLLSGDPVLPAAGLEGLVVVTDRSPEAPDRGDASLGG